jgi:hypothetical protein
MKQHIILVVGMMSGYVIPTWGSSLPEPLVNTSEEGYHVVINLPQTRLFLYKDGEFIRDYPVAVGKSTTQTPVGEYDVTGIALNPTWHIPLSIQKEMARPGRVVPTTVPPGPNNPLGKVFIRFGPPSMSLGIHGTNAPGSIPGFRSHGCVRMHNDNALGLSKMLKKGHKVSVIHQPYLLNEDERGNLWLTAYNDPYRKATEQERHDLLKRLNAWKLIKGQNIQDSLINTVLKEKKSKSFCLTCSSNGKKNTVPFGRMKAWRSPVPEVIPAIIPSLPEPKPLPEDDLFLLEPQDQGLLRPMSLKSKIQHKFLSSRYV